MTIFGKRTTADEVLAGLDLSGKTCLVTGCATGIGFETMRALAARGAHVIGTARALDRAAEACARVTGPTTPVACDQDDLVGVAAAADAIRSLGLTFDAIIANAGIMAPADPDVRDGVECQFRVNHLSHMLLVTHLADQLRERTGRLVMVSSSAVFRAFRGIDLDDLDAHKGYAPFRFYGQSKLANLAFAKSMAERLAALGITSNAIHPGVIVSTGLQRSLAGPMKWLFPLAGPLGKTIPQGAATQCWAAVHPDMATETGGFFADCRRYRRNRFADDPGFRARLWDASDAILRAHVGWRGGGGGGEAKRSETTCNRITSAAACLRLGNPSSISRRRVSFTAPQPAPDALWLVVRSRLAGIDQQPCPRSR